MSSTIKKTIEKIDPEDIGSNPSGNRPFEEVLQQYASRRSVLAGGLSLAATSFFGLSGSADASGLQWKEAPSSHWKKSGFGGGLHFTPVPNSVGQLDNRMPSISEEYEYQVLIPWGTPLVPGSVPEYSGDPNTRPSPTDAALQIGIGHDGMWFFPSSRSGYEGMLAINHEYGGNAHVLGKSMPETLEDVRLSQAVHGVSVVAIKKSRHLWEVTKSSKSRRITANTPVRFSGPAARSPLLHNPNGNVPLGTLNNCGSGSTPWGTFLTCEENFNGYFAATEGANFDATRTEEQARYGINHGGFGYGWEVFDKRFDLSDADYINESHRFGWVVEIDPFSPTQKPVKRTALGRFKHEAAAITVGKGGRAVAYMGDDERFDYIYKFVSADNYRRMLARGVSPLDEGKLYCARFNEDGTGEWLELTIENPVLAARFKDQAEVLIFARIAADLLGATPMDRPEWATVGQHGNVYCALTNNTARSETNAANPQTNNSSGHIIRWVDADAHVGTTFEWDIFILASTTTGTEQTFASPDAIWADPFGRLFVGTDGGQELGLQDQLLVFDTQTGESRRLLTGVNGDEVTGIAVTPDQRTLFVNLQHPGNGDPSASNFPAEQDGVTIPRDCTLVITRKNGGIIGS